MDFRTEVEKTHYIVLDDKELATLLHMLADYKKVLANKMPEGMTTEEAEIFRNLYYMKTGRHYQEVPNFEAPLPDFTRHTDG